MAHHEPSGLDGYMCPRCRAGLDGCDDLACVCICQVCPVHDAEAIARRLNHYVPPLPVVR